MLGHRQTVFCGFEQSKSGLKLKRLCVYCLSFRGMLRNDVRQRGQWRWSHWSFIINFLTAAHPALTFDFGCLHDSGEFLRSFPLLLFECVRKEKQLQKYSLFCLPYVSFSAINIFGTELHKRTKMKKEQEKQNWGDPGEGVWVEQFSSVVHGHVEPLEPIRGQKKWYIIIDIKAAIILTVHSLLCPLQEAQTQTCAWLHSSSVCTVYETTYISEILQSAFYKQPI